MKCQRIKKLINKSIDEKLNPREQEEMEKHLKRCKDCRDLYEDLYRLVEEAPNLPELEPSPHLWEKIQASLLQEETQPSPSYPSRFKISFPSLLPKFRYAVGAALILVILAVSVVIWGPRLGPGVKDPLSEQKYTLAKLEEARHYYQKAVEALTQAFATRQESLDPTLLAELQKSLAVIDTTIDSYERAIRQNPEDIGLQNELLLAYQQKVNVLEEVMFLEGR